MIDIVKRQTTFHTFLLPLFPKILINMKYPSILFFALTLLFSCGGGTDTVKDEPSDSKSNISSPTTPKTTGATTTAPNKSKSTNKATERAVVIHDLTTFEGQLLTLAEIYLKSNSGGTVKIEEIKTKLEKIDHQNLVNAKNFVLESSQKSNKLLSSKFLKKPSKKNLQTIYQIRFVNWNSMSRTPPTVAILDKLDINKVSDTDLLTAYYSMLASPFGRQITKPEPFQEVNINLNDLGLNSEKEKGILFYNLASKFAGKYNLYAKPQPNECNKLKEMSRSFPRINGKNIFEATPPKFEDFKFRMSNNIPDDQFLKRYSPTYEQAKAHYLGCKF